MICPNQPLHCDAYRRFGSAGEPLRWYNSQPAKWGPLTSQRSRLPSDVRTNAPLRVPTSTRTPLIGHSSSFVLGRCKSVPLIPPPQNLISSPSRFDGYPNLHAASSGPGIEFLGVPLEEVGRISGSASDRMTRFRNPYVPDGIERFAQSGYVFTMGENSVFLFGKVHDGEFAGNAGGAADLNSGQIIDAA